MWFSAMEDAGGCNSRRPRFSGGMTGMTPKNFCCFRLQSDWVYHGLPSKSSIQLPFAQGKDGANADLDAGSRCSWDSSLTDLLQKVLHHA